MTAPRWLVGLAIASAFGAWLLGCGGDTPTSVGSDTRSAPDTLRSVDLTAVRTDSVFALPGSLGRATVGQIGQQFPYTAGVLVAFRIPTRTFATNNGVVDTLHADELSLVFATDSLTAPPFTGTMTIGVQEVALGSRGWTRATFIDSLFAPLEPRLRPAAIAPDTLLAGARLVEHPGKFSFKLRASFLAGWDSVRTRGDSLDVNLAVKFRNFAVPGRGFLEIPLRTRAGTLAGTLNAFSANDPGTAIVSAAPIRSRPLVEFDPSYDPGTKLVVSDGFRMHTYLRFAPLRTILPESALVYRAELILTQVDTLTGRSFGTTPSFGVVIPADTTKIYTDSTALRGLAFKSLLAVAPNTQSTIAVSPYYFDIQEKHVTDNGMILRLSNEGSKVRHFEFFGSAAVNPAVRPRVRILYSLPARFERGKR